MSNSEIDWNLPQSLNGFGIVLHLYRYILENGTGVIYFACERVDRKNRRFSVGTLDAGASSGNRNLSDDQASVFEYP